MKIPTLARVIATDAAALCEHCDHCGSLRSLRYCIVPYLQFRSLEKVSQSAQGYRKGRKGIPRHNRLMLSILSRPAPFRKPRRDYVLKKSLCGVAFSLRLRVKPPSTFQPFPKECTFVL
jgi:hypothetical protein